MSDVTISERSGWLWLSVGGGSYPFVPGTFYVLGQALAEGTRIKVHRDMTSAYVEPAVGGGWLLTLNRTPFTIISLTTEQAVDLGRSMMAAAEVLGVAERVGDE